MNRATISIACACTFIWVACATSGEATEPKRRGDNGSQINAFAESAWLQTNGSHRSPKRLDRRMESELALYITDLMRHAEVPGASVAIVQNGKIAYLEGFGLRELGKSKAVTPDTLMMIGSTGKSMTTMMMATLVDEGKISWDTPAVAIYPKFAVSDVIITPQITMRHLVCNCTGMARHDLEIFFAREQSTPELTIGSIRSFELAGAFGKTFGYVNQMVAAGGYIAAWAARGKAVDMQANYLAHMQKRVFDPIGMKRTTFSFEKVEGNRNHATPHALDGSYSYVPLSLDLERQLLSIAPAGASWSNARDTARYLITQLSKGFEPDGRRVVSERNLTATWEPQVEVQAGAHYGLGWVVLAHEGQRLLTHAGGTSGFTSELAFLPDAGLGIAILSNAQNANLFVGAVRSRILELVFGRPNITGTYERRMDEARRRSREKAERIEPLDAAAADARVGIYANVALGRVSLGWSGDSLTLSAGSLASELRSLGGGTYVLWDPPLAGAVIRFVKSDLSPAEFVLDADDPDVVEQYRFARID
jgi:CubicO group peptidase (beta-lactamase class C family)